MQLEKHALIFLGTLQWTLINMKMFQVCNVSNVACFLVLFPFTFTTSMFDTTTRKHYCIVFPWKRMAFSRLCAYTHTPQLNHGSMYILFHMHSTCNSLYARVRYSTGNSNSVEVLMIKKTAPSYKPFYFKIFTSIHIYGLAHITTNSCKFSIA